MKDQKASSEYQNYQTGNSEMYQKDLTTNVALMLLLCILEHNISLDCSYYLLLDYCE